MPCDPEDSQPLSYGVIFSGVRFFGPSRDVRTKKPPATATPNAAMRRTGT